MDEIKPDLVDELLKGYEKPEDIIGENGLLKRLTKALLERALNAELTHHLGYEKHDPAGHNSGRGVPYQAQQGPHITQRGEAFIPRSLAGRHGGRHP